MKKSILILTVLAFAALIFPSGTILAKAQQAATNSEKKAAVDEKKASIQEDKAEKKAEVKDTANAKACEKITKAGAMITDKLSDLEAKLQTRSETRLQIFEKKVAAAEKLREMWRKRVDANIEAQLKKMMAMAKTDEQKDAIIAYETTLKKAITDRRLAINQAQQTFRLRLREAHNLRKENFETIVLGYRQARKTAFDEAQSQCAAGTDSATVRTELKNDLKQARESFQAQIKNREKTNANLETYVTERNQAIRKAQDVFKTTMTQARADLKNALGETEIDETDDTDVDETDDTGDTNEMETNTVNIKQDLKQ